METKNYLSNYYQSHDENGRLMSKHGSVEYITTMRYIEKYLSPDARIIEIGAGTGRYSHALARKGYSVDALELVEHNIEIFKENTSEGEKVTVTQGNATDLSAFESDTYDITLLLGPMYHLFTKEDKLKALSEAIRVTKKGGIVFAAYCNNDATVISACFVRGIIKNEYYRNKVDMDSFKLASDPVDIFAMHRREDVDELMRGFDDTRLHYVGTDMATNFIKETVDLMDDDTFELYLKYHFIICEREDMIGATHHMLDIFRKE